MTINQQSFNEKWAKQVDEQTFVNRLIKEPFWLNDKNKEKKLREAWRLINGVKKNSRKEEQLIEDGAQ